MKNLQALLVFFCLISNLSFAQTCLPNGIVLTTQAEVDAFAVDFPSCTEILGNIEIGFFNGVDNSNITDLSAFSQINTIGGNIRIGRCNQLTTLNGLGNLISVGGDIDIQYNDLLADISGIDALQSVGGLFRILGANGLTSISGLNNLTSVGVLIIGINESLVNITGFNGFTELDGNLSFGGSNISSITGFSNLTLVEGDFILGNIPMLTNISGFNNLNRVNGKMTLVQLDSNTSFAGLEGLTYLGAADIINNGALENFNGLSNVDTIAGRLFIESNATLTNLSGWDDLKHIGKLTLAGNGSIVSLDGIENVTSISEGLELFYNIAFTDLNALSNSLSLTGILSIKGCFEMTNLNGMADLDMSGISNLELIDNTLLTFCNSTNVCDYISTGGVVNISNNAVGCNTITEILANCNTNNSTTCFPNEMIFSNQAQVDIFPSLFPNCTEITGDVKITGTVNNLDSLIQITTIAGDLSIDFSELISLTGLDNLTEVGSLFRINKNSNLINLNGLEGLTSVGDAFVINDNYKLSSLNGLSNLESVEHNFYIGEMDSVIVGFDQFSDLTGLENLTKVGGSFLLYNLENITSLSGFENLDTIGLSLELYGNDGLESLVGVEGIAHIGGGVQVVDHQNLTSFTGFENIELINGNFIIVGNPLLEDISAINNVHTINGLLVINDTEVLTSLAEFSSLVNVETLQVAYNASLTSLSGLENVNTTNLTDLRIFDNPMLSFCNEPNVCDYIAGGGSTNISNNAFGCNDIMLLIEICNPSGATCSLGNVTLSTQSEVDNFPGLFPNCTEVLGDLIIQGDMNNLDSLEQITSVDGYLKVDQCDNLISLNGLNNMTSVGGLEITNLINIKNLNGLENLNEVVTTGIVIGGNDSLMTLNGLGEITNVGPVTISTNKNLEDISALSSLIAIDGNLNIGAHESLTNLFGLQNVTSVSGSIFIESNPVLENIQAIENINLALLSGGIAISYNPSLVTCDLVNLCNHIVNMGGTSISNNASGCNSEQEIEMTCAQNLSKIKNLVFYDLNQNKIRDNGEALLADIPIEISPLGTTSFSNSTNGGVIYLDQGDYVLTLDTLMLQFWDLITDSTDYHITIDSANSCDSVFFGIYPVVFRSFISSFLNGPPARCGEFKTFEVHAKNRGTTVTSGTIWLEVDDIIAQTDYIDIPDTIVNSNIYGWHFDNLFPGVTATKQINILVPIPPQVVLGDSLYFNSYVHFEDMNGIDTSNVFNYVTEVRCSFDPNDKLVNPSRNNNFTLFEEDLFYTIRFQNTGNDEAYDIIVRDTLDENLDPSTFRVLSTSHPNSLNTTMEANQYLTFNFENIYLPDSTTNFDASQGYVSYIISPKEGLAEETTIENTASIYFDFNPPIVTNTTESIMVSELPTSIHNLGGTEGMKIEIFPNPVSDHIFIKKEKSETLEYQIIDVNGRLLRSGILIDEVSNITFTKMNAGVYFVKIINPKTREFVVEKIVK